MNITTVYKKIFRTLMPMSNNFQKDTSQRNSFKKANLQSSKRVQGLTIIESLIALSILGIAFAGLSTAILGLSKANSENHHRREAVRAATHVLESYRLTPISDINANETLEEIVNLSGVEYLVTSSFCHEPEYCISNQLLHIRVDVKLNTQEPDAKELYSSETIFSEFNN